jgi:hypothetical protein
MFEQSLKYWLRLYPSDFRGRYSEEILFTVRDRLHESSKLVYRLRICAEIACDLAISLPRIHLQHRSRLQKLYSVSSIPTGFRLIEQSKPSYWIVVVSAVLSLVLFQIVHSLHPCPGDIADQIRSVCKNGVRLLH